jgi:hypothetical protein
MRSELRSVVVAMVLVAGIVSGGACGGGSSEGGTGGAGVGGMQSALGGAGGGNSCTGPVTEAQAAAICAQAPAGTSVFLVADADCGTTIFSNEDFQVGVIPVSALAVGGDGGRPDASHPAGGDPDAGLADAGGPSDAGLVDAGLPATGELSVSESLAGEIGLYNRAGIPAGPQSLVPPTFPYFVPAGSGTSLVVSVPRNFNLAGEATWVPCRAQSGDVDVTLPNNLSGAGAAVSFTAHCQPYTADGGTPSKDAGTVNPPAQNLVGCFRS